MVYNERENGQSNTRESTQNDRKHGTMLVLLCLGVSFAMDGDGHMAFEGFGAFRGITLPGSKAFNLAGDVMFTAGVAL
eukprot:696153-Amorphochlora_amoeboformis.AAC.2